MQDGRGVPVDAEKAAEHVVQAAALGFSGAVDEGLRMRLSAAQEVALLRAAVRSGHPEGTLRMAQVLEDADEARRRGIAPDDAEAVRLYQLLAASHPIAQINLAYR